MNLFVQPHLSGFTSIAADLTPRMLQNLNDVEPLRHIAVEHVADEIDAVLTDSVRHAQVAIHYLVDAVKGVLLVDDGIQENAQCPYVLLLAVVGLAC